MASYRPDLDASLVVVGNSDEFSDNFSLATTAAYSEIQRILQREYPRETVGE